MSPDEIVAAIDFRHITDALPPERALDILRARLPAKAERIAALERDGHAAYTTSAGWLGYDDGKIRDSGERRGRRRLDGDQDEGRRGRSPTTSAAPICCARYSAPSGMLMTDANQVWEVEQAIEWVNALGPVDPYWIEEPVSPDDILGHAHVRRGVAPVRVATGEHCHNRVMFKQFLQAEAIDVVQLDACRLGGVNEALAVLLLAAAFDKPVCPHAGGVGLCEYVQHLSFFDAACVRASDEGRMIEHAGHLHEHFLDPITIERGRYRAPEKPGYQRRDEAGEPRGIRLPRRRGLEGCVTARRQKVLVLYLANSALDSPVIAWAHYDGTGKTLHMAGDQDQPPYATGLDALKDGWRLFQAAQLLPHARGEEFDVAYLKYEFFFEQLVEI